jgi:uncharacterized protein (TIGR03086 family)
LRQTADAGAPASDDTEAVTDHDVAADTVRRVSELIELGRDREAAELAAGDADIRRGGAGMDVLTQFDELGPLLMGTVTSITPDQLDAPTPCERFAVRGVLEHMIGGATMFAAAFRGEAPAEPDTSDVLAGIVPALTGLVAAIQAPGALDRTIESPFGPMPGETFARVVVLDGLVHGWDLSTATGRAYAPSDALVNEVESFARQVLDPLRDGDTFAAATEPPASATPIERLAAFTGRQV